MKYVFSTLYKVSFDIYQDLGSDSELNLTNSTLKSIKAIYVEDTVYIGELIWSHITEDLSKIGLKAIGYLAEVYLEKKEYEKARQSIQYCFSICSEKSDEELNSYITLLKYYLRLNQDDYVLNTITSIVDHPKLDSESVNIILSTTLKYK